MIVYSRGWPPGQPAIVCFTGDVRAAPFRGFCGASGRPPPTGVARNDHLYEKLGVRLNSYLNENHSPKKAGVRNTVIL